MAHPEVEKYLYRYLPQLSRIDSKEVQYDRESAKLTWEADPVIDWDHLAFLRLAIIRTALYRLRRKGALGEDHPAMHWDMEMIEKFGCDEVQEDWLSSAM